MVEVPHRKGHKITTLNNINDRLNLSGNYIALVRGHAAAISGGLVEDHAHGTRRHVTNLYKIEKSEQKAKIKVKVKKETKKEKANIAIIRSNVMKCAWRIAKEQAHGTSQSPRVFLSMAMKLAWALVKEANGM